MPLIVNGTTIPENVANALIVNGVSITQIIANGVAVWKQALGPTVGWSGNSIVSFYGDSGVQTSGLLFRSVIVNFGAWVDVSVGGTSVVEYTLTYIMSITWSNNIITSTAGSAIIWSVSTKTFSGGEAISLNRAGATTPALTLVVSGGLLRHRRILSDGSSFYGPYISLT